MNSISTSTLFHYTSSMENLLSILENNFLPHFSIETWENVYTKEINMAVPMVSFCDIPLSQIDEHIEKYGKYALGLKKSWGKKKGISPVQYTYHNSSSLKCINQLYRTIVDYEDPDDTGTPIIDILLKYNCFLKPYSGVLWKDGKKGRKIYNYYNEREWRYVPNILGKDKSKIGTMLLVDKYFDQFTAYNKMIDKYDLKFRPNDISYIIIKKESERNEIHAKILEIKGSYPYKDITALATKIISIDQIKNDF